MIYGRIKSRPADFIVQEMLDFSFDGQGEHLYVCVRKCGLNTNDVVDQLRRQFQCRAVDIGISGLKDKMAITDQWFSIRTPKTIGETLVPCKFQPASNIASRSDELSMTAGEWYVLHSARHSRKLRRGAHSLNRFTITIRDVVGVNKSVPFTESIHARLQQLQADGFVNYFGPQRFGINYQNVPAAERLFANPARKMSRNRRSLLISAARSQLFNIVCAERVRAGNWNLPLPGEPMLLNGTNSFFIYDLSTGEKHPNNLTCADNKKQFSDTLARCRGHDIQPSGPLWGAGDSLADGECRQFETSILQLYTTLRDGLERSGLKQQRRSTRAIVEALQWNWQDSSTITLEFNLVKGVYATSFLSEFMIKL